MEKNKNILSSHIIFLERQIPIKDNNIRKTSALITENPAEKTDPIIKKLHKQPIIQ